MARAIPTPRHGNSLAYGHAGPLVHEHTWLENEAFCYPNGGMTRRARARFPDGKLRVVWCGIPDTFFSIPVRRSCGDGYITTDDTLYSAMPEFVFRPHVKSER